MALPATVEIVTLHSDRTLLATAPEDAQQFAEAWTMAMLKQLQPREIPKDLPPLVDDVIAIPVPEQGSLGRADERDIPYGADDTDTSQYMIGDVSVCVIFPESEETVCQDPPACTTYGPDQEDWTDGEITEVKSEIIGAMDWWASRLTQAHLTYTYVYEERLPTGYEPIWGPGTASQYGRCLWMSDALAFLGYTVVEGDCTPAVWEYMNDLRSDHTSNWAFAIFVVDSSEDPDGMFDYDNSFAFAVASNSGGGPYQVMTYDNAGYGIENMDAVCAHETGHIFGALDEYSCECYWASGYLHFENENCAANCLLDEESIMRGGITPFTNGAVDLYARGQVGWQDTDADGILDIEDTHPLLSMPSVPDQTEYSFQLHGSAVVNPLEAPNPYYNTSSINTLTGVEYRLNGGDWLPGLADDGTFDGPEEDFTLDITVSENGPYTIECRAQNNVGNYTDPVFVDEFEVDTATDTPDMPLAFRLDAPVPNPFNPSTSIQYHLPYATEAALTVLDLSGRTVRVLASGHQQAGSHTVIWDGTDSRGHRMSSGVYFYRLEASGYTQTRKMTLLK